MKRNTIKKPEIIEVRRCRYISSTAPPYWSENKHRELYCDKCSHPLVVLFGARQAPDTTKENPRWWVPTAVTCSCLLPKAVALHEVPIMRRKCKESARQLKLLF
jgi:hypothetical protein